MIAKFIAYLIGFPVVGAYAFYLSWQDVVEKNLSYSPLVFAGLIVVVVMWLLYLLVSGITGKIAKRKKTNKAVYVGTAVLVVFSILLTTGVWLALDKVVPDILEDATQSTITYSDLQDDYVDRAQTHSQLLVDFIAMNVANGRLDPANEDLYYAEGFANEDIKALIKASYESIHNDGYNNFSGPLISLADGNRLTIPVLVHLLFDERPDPTYPFTNYVSEFEERDESNKDDPIHWAILDMQPGVMALVSLNISDALPDNLGALTEFLSGAFDKIMGKTMVQDIVRAVNEAIANENVIGSPIYLVVNYDSKTTGVDVLLKPSSESRGVFDYKTMAWFNSNNLLVAVISIFPIRNAFYLLGSLIAISSIILGLIRKKQYAGNAVDDKINSEYSVPVGALARDAQRYGRVTYDPKNITNPYVRSYYRQLEEYDERNSK
jgi:hypothetical protein